MIRCGDVERVGTAGVRSRRPAPGRWKSRPNEAARAARRAQLAVAAGREVERFVEQRRAHGALLVARELAEALGGGQQRHRGLCRGPGEPRGEAAAARDREPARPSPIGTATTCQPSSSNSRSASRAERVGVRAPGRPPPRTRRRRRAAARPRRACARAARPSPRAGAARAARRPGGAGSRSAAGRCAGRWRAASG